MQQVPPLVLTWLALTFAVLALGAGIAGLVVAVRGGWARESRRLREELDDGLAEQRREIVKLRDEWADYGDKLTKRYRNAARALAELNRRSEENDQDQESEHVPEHYDEPRPNGRLPAVPAHVVASGAFGAGRSG